MKFNNEVIEQLDNYVYRLIDPRNGNTFYVGRGKGNRVFAHVAHALNNFEGSNYLTKEEIEDDSITKNDIIREIENSGLKVIHVIQRWGLTEGEAKEVESALIDAFPGLSNLQSGYGRDRGVSSVQEIITSLSKEEFKYNPMVDKFILIKVKQEVADDFGLYEATRKSWVLNLERAKEYRIVLSVINGVVRKVYEVDEWYIEPTNTKRIGFKGKEASNEISEKFVNKRLPEEFRKKGSANPAQYSK